MDLFKRIMIVVLSLLGGIVQAQDVSLATLDSLFEKAYADGNKKECLKYGDALLKASAKQSSKQDTQYLQLVIDLSKYYSDRNWMEETQLLLDENLKEEILQKELFPQNIDLFLTQIALSLYGRKMDKMRSEIDQATTLQEKWGMTDSEAFATTLYYEGEYWMTMGDNQKALAAFEKALILRQKVLGEYHEDCGQVVNAMAILQNRMGNFEEANALYELVLEILKKNDNTNGIEYAAITHNQARLNRAMGRYANAERMFKESLGILEELFGKKHSASAQVMQGIAYVYRLTGRYEEAETILKEELQILEEIMGKDHPKYGLALDHMGGVYKESGRYEEAEPYYLEALEVLSNSLGKEHSYYRITGGNLAILYLRMKAFEKAEALQLKTLEGQLKQNGPQHKSVLTSRNNLADVYRAWGKLDAVEEQVFEVLKATALDTLEGNLKDIALKEMLESHRFSHNEHSAVALAYLAEAYQQEAETNKDEALDYAKKSHDAWKAYAVLIDKFRATLGDDQDKLRISRENHLEFGKSIQNCLLLSELTGEKDYLRQAILFADRNKSALLTDALKNKTALSFGAVPDSLIQQRSKISKEITNLESELVSLKAKTDKELGDELNAKLAKAYQQKSKLMAFLEKNYPKYYELNYNQRDVDLSKLQENLGEKTVLLEFFIAGDNRYGLCLTSKSTEIYLLPELSNPIDSLRRLLTDYNYIKENAVDAKQEYLRLGHWFYQQLIEKVIKEEEMVENLIIIPDGKLGYIPFEVFLTDSPKETRELEYSEMPYLIKKVSISYNYSLALKEELSAANKKSGNQKIYAAAASYGQNTDSTSLERGMQRAVHLRNLRSHLKELPAVKGELTMLSEILQGEFRYGQEANEAAFKRGAADYSIIHLAMHGLVNNQYPILSSMVFSENRDSSQDNFLQAYEISQMQLDAELVVLSACETGYGKFQQGEGVMSLARSFMYAGVPSLVVSLWQVNDASTAIIMEDFYKELAKGSDKAKALQQAKLKYLQQAAKSNPAAAHPAFWAAFIQLGDSRPIQITEKGGVNGSYLLWGLGLLVLVGAGIWAWRSKAAIT